MNGDACETCRFWHGLVDDANWMGRVTFRQCRRYPPSIRTKQYEKDNWGHASFPATPSKAWCGEYQPAGLSALNQSQGK